ncbi:hypothetical protein PAXINDRAFT_21785 [Paxillus involutus ATCC 200175]|uniref:Uncharacterized protein n=1 Tax=Paxillus involutus ATCC 200175 TaxID=664439 RepID=A0A0C9TCC9_PAXIN|nr:hypothetical protein PAXINDRAFT_21785 [Paxillus involutus ATCC 200175]
MAPLGEGLTTYAKEYVVIYPSGDGPDAMVPHYVSSGFTYFTINTTGGPKTKTEEGVDGKFIIG